MTSQNWQTTVEALKKASKVVVFTVAGISVESSIPTFRDSSGFWTECPPHLFTNCGGLAKVAQRDPESLAQFILHLVEPIAKGQPNAVIWQSFNWNPISKPH